MLTVNLPKTIAEQKGTPTQAGKPTVLTVTRSVEENLELFEKMKNGETQEGEHVLRAKIDMASKNMLMRDPVMYRTSASKTPSHREMIG